MATDQINVAAIPFKSVLADAGRLTGSAKARTSKPAKANSANSAATAKAHSAHWRKAMKRQSFSAAGIGLAIIVLTALSLSHLASGIAIVTHSPGWQGWALAIGIDVGFILMELACIVTVADKVRHVVERYARPAIAGTLLGSAAMNAFAFAGDADTLIMQIAGSIMGCVIPALIYAMTRIAAAQYIDCHSRQ
jgi:hypothetical protein